MKIQFEEEDALTGVYVIKETSNKGSKDLGFARSVAFKIGFITGLVGQPYCLISMLTDGMVLKIGNGTKSELVEHLNKTGYRCLTKNEYIAMIESTGQGFI